MPEIPEKRQSIRPPRRVLLAGLLALVALVAVLVAVTAALHSGNDDCPASTSGGGVSKRCT
jgi:hypothetical protein